MSNNDLYIRLIDLLKSLPKETTIAWTSDDPIDPLPGIVDVYIPYLQTELKAYWIWTVYPWQPKKSDNPLDLFLAQDSQIILTVHDGLPIKAKSDQGDLPIGIWQRSQSNWSEDSNYLGTDTHGNERYELPAHTGNNISKHLNEWAKTHADRDDITFNYVPGLENQQKLSVLLAHQRGSFLNEIASNRSDKEREAIRKAAQKVVESLDSDHFERHAVFFCNWCGQISVEEYDQELMEPESIICECGEWLNRLSYGEDLPES